jgi:hypothetical protein
MHGSFVLVFVLVYPKLTLTHGSIHGPYGENQFYFSFTRMQTKSQMSMQTKSQMMKILFVPNQLNKNAGVIRWGSCFRTHREIFDQNPRKDLASSTCSGPDPQVVDRNGSDSQLGKTTRGSLVSWR